MGTKMGKKLVAVLDVNLLKLFDANGLKIQNNPCIFSLDSGHTHKSDRHLGYNQQKSGASSFYDPTTSSKEITIRESSKLAATHIENQLRKSTYHALFIVCDAKLLGVLRDDLSLSAKKILSRAINKDLIHHSTDLIEKAIFS